MMKKTMNTPAPDKRKRILALDVMRGITIAGMLLVNNPGSWETVYAPLRHADWNGLTPTDLVFPFFMFMMGISTYISLRKYQFQMSGAVLTKILRRTAVIFALGLLIDWFSRLLFMGSGEALETIRILGVLQRLALCYGVVSILTLTINHRYLPVLTVCILAGYAVLLLVGHGFERSDENILIAVDNLIITPQHLYQHEGGLDPEGLLSTLPSIAHTLIGFLVGRMMLGCGSGQDREDRLNAQVQSLLLAGVVLTFAGWLLSYGCPINKKVWSPTFVLTTCGLASSLLGLLIWVIDIKGKRGWCLFFETFGVNPLFLYVFGSLLAILFGYPLFPIDGQTTGFTSWIHTTILAPLLGSYGGSLAYALLFITLCWIVGYWLYRRRIYIKI